MSQRTWVCVVAAAPRRALTRLCAAHAGLHRHRTVCRRRPLVSVGRRGDVGSVADDVERHQEPRARDLPAVRGVEVGLEMKLPLIRALISETATPRPHSPAPFPPALPQHRACVAPARAAARQWRTAPALVARQGPRNGAVPPSRCCSRSRASDVWQPTRQPRDHAVVGLRDCNLARGDLELSAELAVCIPYTITPDRVADLGT